MSESYTGYRDYAWAYFQVHAQQRLQTFEFYITISTALLAGFIGLREFAEMGRLSSLIGVGLIFNSFIFWKLDSRTRELIKNAENALIEIERIMLGQDEGEEPGPLKLFSRDEFLVKAASPWPLLVGHFTYSRCFRWVFGFFSFAGVGIICLALSG
jgi:hypothetical protein